jgi:hypothetical protein
MQIGDSKYSVGTSSWKNRTPLMLKFGCDILLLVSLMIAVIWPIDVLALKIGVAIKLLSNFIMEHIPVAVQQEIKDNPIVEPNKQV